MYECMYVLNVCKCPEKKKKREKKEEGKVRNFLPAYMEYVCTYLRGINLLLRGN